MVDTAKNTALIFTPLNVNINILTSSIRKIITRASLNFNTKGCKESNHESLSLIIEVPVWRRNSSEIFTTIIRVLKDGCFHYIVSTITSLRDCLCNVVDMNTIPTRYNVISLGTEKILIRKFNRWHWFMCPFL